MSGKRVHIAIGVPTPEKLREAVDYYTKLLNEEPLEDGLVFLGTGREVTGAYWKTDLFYVYVFLGHEFGEAGGGLDHLGIQYRDDCEMNNTRERVASDRWSKDPVGVTWELFPDVFND